MSKKAATLKYVLKPGFTHYMREPDEADGLHGDVVKLKPGAVVDLNAAQAENFADRFELLTAVQARAEAEIAMAKAATAVAEEQEAAPVAEAAATPPAATEAPAEATAEPVTAPAEATTEAAVTFELVNVEEYTADGLIEIIGELELEAAVRQIADDEVGRGSKKRSTVLAAADERLEELEEELEEADA